MDTTSLEKTFELLKEFSTAMLVTHSGTGELRARPMALAKVDPSCVMWFVTSQESAKAHEIESDTRVMVICQKSDSCHLSLNGSAQIVKDRSLLDGLWNETFRLWFPEGTDDPHIALIRVDPSDAEYWDNRGGKKVRFAVQAAKAYLTGNPLEPDSEQHDRMSLR